MPGETMKCEEFAEIVHDLAQSRQLGRVETAIARAHAENCPACACLLAEAERLAAALREASAESRSLQTPERIELGLLDVFCAANPAPRQQPLRYKPRWLLGLGYAGAALMLSILTFSLSPRLPDRHPSPAIARKTEGSATVAVVKRQTSAHPALSAVLVRNVVSRPNANLATGFVPVPFSGGIARGDAGVIVRVQVPRSALAELGYPVGEASGGGMVQADLLVGEDGWPHAVRIVR